MSFALKKLIGGLLMPIPLIVLLLLLAMILMYRRAKRLALVLGLIAISSLYLLSIEPIVKLIASPLEFAYPAYAGQNVEYVVVLGSGHQIDSRIANASQLSRTGYARLTTGLSVLQAQPNARLLLSGYAGNTGRSHALVAADAAQQLGTDPNRILLATEARDTHEEALAWKDRLREQPFALVTSAMHMPRAMRLFEAYGLKPIAAPANYETAGQRPTYWRDWLPRASNLAVTEAAWHEYLGIAWFALRGSQNPEK